MAEEGSFDCSAPEAKKMKWNVEAEAEVEVKDVDYWNILPFPTEVNHRILHMAAMLRVKERLAMGWKEIHHAFKPCSVCGKLLHMDVEDGEIKSVGKEGNVFQNIDWWLTTIPKCGRIHGFGCLR